MGHNLGMSSTPVPASDKIDAAVLKIAGVVVLGAIMAILDITVVSVALPTFQRVFDTNYANVAWTMTGYTLALATVIPLTGWAADRFGTKRLYMLAIVLFVAGVSALFGASALLLPSKGAKFAAMIAIGLVLMAILGWMAARADRPKSPLPEPPAQ